MTSCQCEEKALYHKKCDMMIASIIRMHNEFSSFSTNTLKMHVWESGRESHYGLVLVVFFPHLGIRSMDFLYSVLITVR